MAKLLESRARLINNQTFLIKSNNQQRSVQCRGRGHSFGAPVVAMVVHSCTYRHFLFNQTHERRRLKIERVLREACPIEKNTKITEAASLFWLNQGNIYWQVEIRIQLIDVNEKVFSQQIYVESHISPFSFKKQIYTWSSPESLSLSLLARTRIFKCTLPLMYPDFSSCELILVGVYSVSLFQINCSVAATLLILSLKIS